MELRKGSVWAFNYESGSNDYKGNSQVIPIFKFKKKSLKLTLGRTRKFIPLPCWLMEPLLRIFDMLPYFETILPSVERL